MISYLVQNCKYSKFARSVHLIFGQGRFRDQVYRLGAKVESSITAWVCLAQGFFRSNQNPGKVLWAYSMAYRNGQIWSARSYFEHFAGKLSSAHHAVVGHMFSNCLQTLASAVRLSFSLALATLFIMWVGPRRFARCPALVIDRTEL